MKVLRKQHVGGQLQPLCERLLLDQVIRQDLRVHAWHAKGKAIHCTAALDFKKCQAMKVLAE